MIPVRTNQTFGKLRILHKSIAFLLVAIIIFGILPVAAFTAAAEGNGGETSSENENTIPAAVMGTVTADALEVRSEPGSAGEVLLQLEINARIEILEQTTVDGVEWGRIEEGWVDLTYVSLDEQTEPAGEDMDDPKPTEPKPTEPKPTEPKPTEPKPTEPKPTEPKPTEPKPIEPVPTEPKPTEPKPTEPKPTEPKPTEPKPTEPKPTEPKPTEPKPTEPKPTEPEPTDAADLEGLQPPGNDSIISLAPPTRMGTYVLNNAKLAANNDGLVFNKYVTTNNDGTYQLELTVEGSYEQMKLDLIIIIDRSNSMLNNDKKEDRLTPAKNAASGLIDIISKNPAVNARYRIMDFSGSGHSKANDDAITAAHSSYKVVGLSSWYTDAAAAKTYVTGNSIKVYPQNLYEGSNLTDSYGSPIFGTTFNGKKFWYNLRATNYEAAFRNLNSITTRTGATKVVVFMTDGDPTVAWEKVGTKGQKYDGYNNSEGYGTTFATTNNIKMCTEALTEEMAALKADRLYLVGFGEANAANLRKIAGYTTAANVPYKKVIGSSSSALQTDLKAIGDDIFFTKVNITDTLSHNAAGNTLMNVTNANTIKVTVNTGSKTYTGATVSLPKTNVNAAITLKPVYDSAKGTLTLDFPDGYRLENGYTYSVSATIAPTEAAYRLFRDNGQQYQDQGAGNTGTHSGQMGIPSNDSAVVTYSYKGNSGSKAIYPHPVVQLLPGTLKVGKTFSGLPDGQALPQDFALNVTINYPSDGDSNTPDTVTKTLTLADLQQPDGYYYTFTGLSPNTTYSITETNYTLDYFKSTIATKVNGAAYGTTATVGGTVEKAENETVDFENSYEVAITNVTLGKLVTGNMGSWEEPFEFTATISSGSMKNIKYSINGAEAQTITSDSFTFSLKHDDTIVFSYVPRWTTLTIKENNPGNYSLTTVVDGDKTLYPEDDSATVDVTAVDGHTVTFTNRWNVEIETGIVLDSLPYILILVGVAVAGVFLFLRKARRYDD